MVMSSSRELRVVEAEHAVRELEHRFPVTLGNADHLADHLERQLPRDVEHEVAFAVLDHVVDDLVRQRAHVRFHPADRLVREPFVHDLAQQGVPRGVGHDHHVSARIHVADAAGRAFERLLAHRPLAVVVEDDPLAGDERVRVDGDLDHVAVLRDVPEARPPGAFVVVDGGFASKRRERSVVLTADEHVDIASDRSGPRSSQGSYRLRFCTGGFSFGAHDIQGSREASMATMPGMDLRYSADDERFRAELRAWLDKVLPTLSPKPEKAEDWPARRAYDTSWQRLLHEGRLRGDRLAGEVRRPRRDADRGADLPRGDGAGGCAVRRRELRRTAPRRADDYRRRQR